METLPQISSALQAVLTTTAEQVGAELHFIRRPDVAKFSASTLVQTLTLGWLAHPDASLEQLTQTAARVGVSVSQQALDQRFTFATATLLRTLLLRSLEQVIGAHPTAIPILRRFKGVRVQDSTTIVLPDALSEQARGCGGSSSTNTAAALKCGLQFDLLNGAFTHLDLLDGRASDHHLPLQHASLPPGTLRLADLGFYDLSVFADIEHSGAYFLSKVEASTRVNDEQGGGKSLLTFVRELQADEWDGSVVLGSKHKLQLRLLLKRVPQEVADQRRRRIRKAAREKGQTASAAALALAEWTVLITNVPRELLTLEQALVLAKVRWQIELMFKLWKSQGKLDEWRSKRPARIMCEVYAKLLAMVVQQWCLIVGCWQYPDRSLVKAAQVVRDHALELASARGRLERLSETLQTIQAVLKRTARMNPRKQRPNTYQLLLALSPE